MPKQLETVDSFTLGSFCGVDPKDIPNGGFALSINIDPTKKLGAAVPRTNDVYYISDEEDVGAGTGMGGGFEYHNGDHRVTLLSADAATDKLYYSEDKANYASKNVSAGFEDSGRGRFISAADGSVRMAVGANKDPQYFAEIVRNQYPSTSTPIATDAYTMMDSHAFPPSAFGSCISVDWDEDVRNLGWYYLLNNHPYLYRSVTGAEEPFEHTRSDIAMSHPIKVVGAWDNTRVYVLDDAVNKIYIFNATTLAKVDEIDLASEIESGATTATFTGGAIATGFDVYRESATVVFMVICWVALTSVGAAEGERVVSILKVTSDSTVAFVGTDWSDEEAADARGLYVDRALMYVDGSTDAGGTHFLNRGYEDVCWARVIHQDKATGTKDTLTIAAARNKDAPAYSAVIDYYEFNIEDEVFDGTVHEGFMLTETVGANHSIQGIAWSNQADVRDGFVALLRIYTDSVGAVTWEHFTDDMYLRLDKYNWDGNTAAVSTEGLALSGETWVTRDHLRLAPYSGTDTKILMATGGAPSAFITAAVTTNGDANTADSMVSFGITGRLIDGLTIGEIVSESKVYYKVAVVYDGSQMSALGLSPVVYVAWVRNSVSGSTTAEGDYKSYKMQIMIPSGMNNVRWTSIRIFRAEASVHEADVPESAYQFVSEIPLDDKTIPARRRIVTWDYLTASPAYNRYVVTTTDQDPSSGIVYESFNGVVETQPDTVMRYKFCATGNKQSFVLGCTHPNIEDLHDYLFKSKRNLLDTFDWSIDFSRLPLSGPPIGLGYFQGRAVCFDESTMVVVNERTMAIENVYQGVGCISHETIVSTKFGLIWADAGNIYMWAGGQPTVISKSIEIDNVLSTYGWRDQANKERASAAFDTERLQYLLFMGKDGSDVGLVAVYTVPQNRWDFLQLTTGSYVSPTWFTLFNSLEGEVVVPLVNNTTFRVHEMYGDAGTNRAALVYTKTHAFGNPNAHKRLLDLIFHHTGTPVVTASYDEAAYGALTEATEVANKVFRATLNQKVYTVSYLFTVAAADELSSYGTSYREVRR